MGRRDDLEDTSEGADVDPEGPEDEFLPEDFADDPDDVRPRSTRKRVGRGGQMIGAALIGLAEVLAPKPKVEIPIEIATPGEPPNIDTKGLDEAFGDDGERLVGPPMDRLKSQIRSTQSVKRRR